MCSLDNYPPIREYYYVAEMYRNKEISLSENVKKMFGLSKDDKTKKDLKCLKNI